MTKGKCLRCGKERKEIFLKSIYSPEKLIEYLGSKETGFYSAIKPNGGTANITECCGTIEININITGEFKEYMREEG